MASYNGCCWNIFSDMVLSILRMIEGGDCNQEVIFPAFS